MYVYVCVPLSPPFRLSPPLPCKPKPLSPTVLEFTRSARPIPSQQLPMKVHLPTVNPPPFLDVGLILKLCTLLHIDSLE